MMHIRSYEENLSEPLVYGTKDAYTEADVDSRAVSMMFREDYLYNPLLATSLKSWKIALLFAFIEQEMIDYEKDYVSLSDHEKIKKEIGFGRTELRLTKLKLLEHGLISKITRNREALFCVNLRVPHQITTAAGLDTDKFFEIQPVNVKRLQIPCFKRNGGDARCAILLSAITEYLPPSYGADFSEWVTLNQKVIMERTGLSLFDQKIARDNLRDFGILETKKEGYPVVHSFRINYEQLAFVTYDYVESTFHEN